MSTTATSVPAPKPRVAADGPPTGKQAVAEKQALVSIRPPLPIRICGILSSWYVLATILFSSFIINFIQLIVSLLVFVSGRDRIAINQKLANTWWELFCYMTEVWSGIPYRFTGSIIIPNGGSCMMLGNHERGIDFTTGISIISRSPDIGCGRMMTMMKKSLQYVPTVGWTHYFQGSLFLNRNWETDSKAITAKLADMEQGRFPRPFWIGMYPEGTRITPTKKAASIKFAQERGLPQLQNVLLPRTKGFTFLLKNLPTTIDAIYDCTCAYGGSPLYLSHPFTQGGFATRTVHIHIDRIPFASLPKTEKEQSDWLMTRFVEKDRLLEYFKEHGCFPGEEVKEHRAKFHHLLTIFLLWSVLLTSTLFFTFGSHSYIPLIFVGLQLLALIKSIYHITNPRPYDIKVDQKKQKKAQ